VSGEGEAASGEQGMVSEERRFYSKKENIMGKNFENLKRQLKFWWNHSIISGCHFIEMEIFKVIS